MASFNQKGILGTKKKLEIQWFKDKYIENGKIEGTIDMTIHM